MRSRKRATFISYLYSEEWGTLLAVMGLVLGIVLGIAFSPYMSNLTPSKVEKYPESFMFTGLVVNDRERMRVLHSDIIVVGILAPRNTSLESSLELPFRYNWLVNIAGYSFATSEVIRATSLVAGSRGELPTIVVPQPGFYVIAYNISFPTKAYLKKYFLNLWLVGKHGKVIINTRETVILVSIILLIVIAYILYTNPRRQGILGWVLGLSVTPVIVFLISFFYVASVGPLQPRLSVMKVSQAHSASLISTMLSSRDELVDFFLSSFSPLSYYRFLIVWGIITAGTVLLLWGAPLESRLETYERIVYASRNKLFLYKNLVALLVSTLPIPFSEIGFLWMLYPGFIGASFTRVMVLFSDFLSLFTIALLIQSLALLLVLVLRRGSLAAMIIGVILIVVFTYYQGVVTVHQASLSNAWRSVLGLRSVLPPRSAAWVLAKYLASALAAYILSYLIYVRREVQ